MTKPENNSADWAPVAVFAYNRPAHIIEMMASLSRCDGFESSPIIVFVDGPRTEREQSDVEAVRDFIESLRLPNVSWEFQQTNRGLRNSIYAGVTKVVRQYGRVIVLEDDLRLSPVALRYFNSALARYESENQVWNVGGYIYDVPSLRNHQTTLTLPFAHPWGWATWDRAWDQFRLDSRPTQDQLRSKSFANAFNVNGLHPYTSTLKASIEGRVNSWFIHWYYTIFQHNGMSIFPPRRVLENLGTNNGTHGGRFNPYDLLVPKPSLLTELPEFSNINEVDYLALDSLKSCWETRVRRFITRAGMAKRTMLPRRANALSTAAVDRDH